ncbi:MAG: VWA domain-containing protein [Proteobacteria bacterium]|nr:VWA domain-containing protein [Pseudomonadota bacterium]
MTSPTKSRQRARSLLTVLLGISVLATGCGATSYSPTMVVVPWPEPAPQPQPTQPAPVQTRPNFSSPSAAHCARPVQTVEVPGRVAGTQWPEPTMPGGRRVAREDEMRASAELAAPAPTPVPRPSAAPAAPATSDAAGATAGAAARKEAPVDGFAPPSVTAELFRQRQRLPRQEVVTAGMVDDNADFSSYLQFRQRNAQVPHRERDVSERHLLQVRNAAGDAVPDAEVAVRAANGAAMWARTDAGGRAWLHPRAFDSGNSTIYEVAVRKNGRQATGFLRRGQKSAVEITLDAASPPRRAKLDLVFLVDATGSMGDEIAKLRATLHTIARQVAALPSRPDTCFGLVAYRDKGDDFLLRRHDLTNDLGGFQQVLDALQAAGGGDYPEAMNEALHDAVHNISWRGNDATRLVVLLADAPPHLDYGGPQYDDDMLAALGKGIKLFGVGASGLDTQGEYVQRQIAQYTGGRFVFLTYAQATNPASGPGRETVHEVSNYSVDTLDRLIVRLVSEELGKLPKGG